MLALRKGQIITIDLIFALVITIAVVYVINEQWSISIRNMDNYRQVAAAEKAAHIATAYLINSQGYPPAWDSTTVQLVGLTKDLGVIDSRKVTELKKLDPYTLGERLGAPDYNIHINFTLPDNTQIDYAGVPPVFPNISSRVLSFVSYNGNISRLYLTVWK